MQKNQCQSCTDQELLDRILGQQAGWRNMLSELLKRNHGALQARCHAYLRNREDAEDATQETQLRAYRAIRTFRGESGFRTWLFAIAERQCHNLVCRRKRHLLDEHVRALIEIHEATLPSAGASTDQRDAVRHILTQLPEEARDVLMLRFYRDLSLEEMAVTLQLGLSATKMRLYRALDRFSALFQQEQVCRP